MEEDSGVSAEQTRSSRSRRACRQAAARQGSRRQAENGSDQGMTRNRHFRAETVACRAGAPGRRPAGGREDAGGATAWPVVAAAGHDRSAGRGCPAAAPVAGALTLFLLAGLIPETVATYNTPPLVLLARPLDLLFLSASLRLGGAARARVHSAAARPLASILLLGWPLAASTRGYRRHLVQGPARRYALIGGVGSGGCRRLMVFHALLHGAADPAGELMFPARGRLRWLGRAAGRLLGAARPGDCQRLRRGR